MSTETLVSSHSRRSFLQTAGATGLAVGASSLLAGCGGGSNNSGRFSNSVKITMSSIANAFKSIQADEDHHVSLLQSALGADARPAPTFTSALLTAPQTDIGTFIRLASALGNVETGAYLAAVPLPNLLASPTTLETASAIAIVEGRHAGFLNAVVSLPLLTDVTNGTGSEPNNHSLNGTILPDQVAQFISPFIGTVVPSGTPPDGGTSLNGGAALPTDADVTTVPLSDILNYALFAEYVGSTFYNLNVPHFFGS